MTDQRVPYRIRFARARDIPAIIELMRPYNMHHIPSPEMGELDDKHFLVAEADGRLIGATGYTFISPEVGKTTLMAVNPAYTGHGLGMELQTSRMRVLRSLGCEKIITNADRPATIAWYKRHFGYREIGRLPKIHSFGLDDVHEWTTLEADLTSVASPVPSREKLLINVALTGIKHIKSDNPHLPVTPEEIAADALEVARLGAAVVHLHARDTSGAPTPDASVYAEIISRIREKNTDLIICVSSSGRNWQGLEKRSAVLNLDADVKPDMVSLTLGSMNFPDQASVNPPDVIQALARGMLERGIKPELEVFETGMIDYGRYLIRKGLIRQPGYFNLMLGSLGTISAAHDSLTFLVGRLPAFSTWAASGIGRYRTRVREMAAAAGGGLRTGLEDHLYLDEDKKQPATNGALISQVLEAAARHGREIATPREVRNWLELDTT